MQQPSEQSELKPEFKVLVVYEDLAARIQAKQTCEQLSRSLAGECEFQCDSWKLDSLSIPGLADLAATAAIHADMVIVASRGRLTVSFKDWVEDWLGRYQGEQKALVALLDKSTAKRAETTSLHTYLQSVATRGNMKYFQHYETMAPPDKDRIYQLVGSMQCDESGHGLN